MKKSKILTLALCAVLLVATTVLGTMAYLTSQAEVVNTFTVGKVVITLDEADVDDSTPNAERDTANKYHLIPGKSYDKDPILHVADDSEDCWLFVKVANGISACEAAESTDYKPIAKQIADNGWTALEGVANVYYKAHDKDADPVVKDYPVFAKFAIAGSADATTLATAETANITVTGYAVQAEGFATALEAWNATFGAPANP